MLLIQSIRIVVKLKLSCNIDLIFGFSTSKNWKTLSFISSYTLAHQKLITNQLYSSDKMMVRVTKTHIILCLMIFHSTRSKNELIFGFSTWKQLENTLFSNSYAHTHKELISNQLYSSDQIMAQVTKAIIIYCLIIFHSTKSKNDLIRGFSTSKQLENTLFR